MNTKKLISAILTASTLFCSFAFDAKCNTEDVFTNIYTDYENDLDESGLWKYRELVPDVGCETLDGFTSKSANTQGSTTQTNTELNDDAHTGEYSISRYTRTNAGIGFYVPKLQTNEAYIFSAWLKGECNETSVTKMSPARNYTKTSGSATEGIFARYSDGKGTQFNTNDTWKYYSEEVKMTEDTKEDTKVHVYLACVMDNGFKDNMGKHVQNLFVDDWSMRLKVPQDFMATEMLAPVYDSEENTLTYKFNMDIDPRTVRIENIEVNNERNSEYIESAVLEITNEETREHTLTLTMQNFEEGLTYAVLLPELKDAWGREVIGNESFVIGTYPEGQYTIFDDLDDSGAWKYRELIPDISCETIDDFWDKGTVAVAPQTNVALSTDSYRGEYSISRTMQGYAALGAKIPNIDMYTAENPADYILSMYARADLAEGLKSVNLVPCYSLYEDGTKKENAFNYPNVDMNIPINEEWTYYTKKMRITGISGINKTKDIHMFFYANAKDASGTTVPNTIYLDEWSLRRALPEDFFASEVTDAQINDNKAVFTFNLDIDPRTVRAEDILINGKSDVKRIESINIETKEYTRVTTLEINLCNLKADMDYTIDISSVRDAWGRSIEGAKTVEFSTPAAIDMTIEFKSNGKTVTKMTDGDIEAKLSLVNNMASKDVIIVAAVCKDNRFVSVTSKEISLDKGDFESVELEIDAGEDNDSIRLFFWENSEEGLPLSNYGELSKDGFNKAVY